MGSCQHGTCSPRELSNIIFSFGLAASAAGSFFESASAVLSCELAQVYERRDMLVSSKSMSDCCRVQDLSCITVSPQQYHTQAHLLSRTAYDCSVGDSHLCPPSARAAHASSHNHTTCSSVEFLNLFCNGPSAVSAAGSSVERRRAVFS